MFKILCFVQYILGVWKIPSIQFPQWSQTALPDNVRVASPNSSALCHEQWVFINTGSSDGECGESLGLSNIVSCGLCNWNFNCNKLHLDVILFPSFYCLFSVETSLWPPWIRPSRWHSVASWWPERHHGPQYRYLMEDIGRSLKSFFFCLFFSIFLIFSFFSRFSGSEGRKTWVADWQNGQSGWFCEF